MNQTPLPEFHRAYRAASTKPGELSFQVIAEESDLWITACATGLQPNLPERVAGELTRLRAEIKNTILLNPLFKTSLTPLNIDPQAPALIKSMAHGAKIMGVGPMAAVAGAVAEAVARCFADECHGDIIVENGGDTYLFSTKERVVALLPDPASQAMLGVLVKPEDAPVSFCASSGKFGHSLSLGQGDLAVIRARDGALADAAATAICNLLKSAKDVDKALERVKQLQDAGLEGAFVQCAGRIGVWGNMELAAV